MLRPKYRLYFRKALPFGLIWLVFGLIYALLEYGLLGHLDFYPTTGNRYDFQSTMTFTVALSFFMGYLQGWIEVAWLGRKFEKQQLWVKILVKGLFYLLLIIFFVLISTMVTNANRYDSPVFGTVVWQSVWAFISKFSFWSIIIYVGAIVAVALFVSEIGDYLGTSMFYNFLLGKYHNPKQETRIFMFLDMKSSTAIAEKIGHENYFDLLKMYYAHMTDPILESDGEIYQYVGDEIVISWKEKNGLYQNNCIECFLKIKSTLEKMKQDYETRFGVTPNFKAGFHIGGVTTGEIGIIKKDIIYTGDTLNTTARIQALCNEYKADILLSKKLKKQLAKKPTYTFEEIGKLQLRGKSEFLQLYKLNFRTR